MPLDQFFVAGGPVMWPLASFLALAIVLIIERLFFWLRLRNRQKRLVPRVLKLYPHHRAATHDLLEKHADYSPIARIFLEALLLDHPSPDGFRLALESAAQAELPRFRRYNTIFDTVISVAPLLGLLGTILGLIDAFAFLRVGQVGGDETANVTAGISEALVSTAAGLIVAIITLLFTNLFRGLYRRQLALLQKYLGDFELKYRQEYEQRMDAYYAQQEFYRPQTPYLRDSDPDYDGDPDGPNSGGPDVPSV